jgi:hypothetical protein
MSNSKGNLKVINFPMQIKKLNIQETIGFQPNNGSLSSMTEHFFTNFQALLMR